MIGKIYDKIINSIAEIMGLIGSLLILYCMIFGVTDVFLRYALNSASQWIGATIQAAMVLIACMGSLCPEAWRLYQARPLLREVLRQKEGNLRHHHLLTDFRFSWRTDLEGNGCRPVVH